MTGEYDPATGVIGAALRQYAACQYVNGQPTGEIVKSYMATDIAGAVDNCIYTNNKIGPKGWKRVHGICCFNKDVVWVLVPLSALNHMDFVDSIAAGLHSIGPKTPVKAVAAPAAKPAKKAPVKVSVRKPIKMSKTALAKRKATQAKKKAAVAK